MPPNSDSTVRISWTWTRLTLGHLPTLRKLLCMEIHCEATHCPNPKAHPPRYRFGTKRCKASIMLLMCIYQIIRFFFSSCSTPKSLALWLLKILCLVCIVWIGHLLGCSLVVSWIDWGSESLAMLVIERVSCEVPVLRNLCHLNFCCLLVLENITFLVYDISRCVRLKGYDVFIDQTSIFTTSSLLSVQRRPLLFICPHVNWGDPWPWSLNPAQPKDVG